MSRIQGDPSGDIYREANRAADFLARAARDTEGIAVDPCILVEPVEEIRNVISSYYMGRFISREAQLETRNEPYMAQLLY